MLMHQFETTQFNNFAPKLFAVAQAWRRAIGQVIAAHGMTEASALSLVTLYREGDGIRQNKLADSLGLESASVVRVLDGLENNGYVRRQQDQNDRRAKLVWLTAEGLILTSELEKLFTELREEVMKDVELHEIQTTENLLNKISKSLTDRACQRKE